MAVFPTPDEVFFHNPPDRKIAPTRYALGSPRAISAAVSNKRRLYMTISMRWLCAIAAVGCFAGSALADQPKTYRITIGSASTIGAVELPSGDYRLVVDTHEPKVQLEHVGSGKTTELEAKIVTGDRKFDYTAITSDRSGGSNRIKEIRIGGSKTLVTFN
jgi:hypothetical protein